MALVSSCYSWQLGPGDGGVDGPARDTGGQDGAHTGHDAARDGTADARSDAADARAVRDAPSADAPADRRVDASCAALLSAAAEARAAAVACTLGTTDCETSVLDACGCRQFVTSASSAATTSYVAAVGAVKNAGCAVCIGEVCTTATEGLCLESLTGDSSVSVSCSP